MNGREDDHNDDDDKENSDGVVDEDTPKHNHIKCSKWLHCAIYDEFYHQSAVCYQQVCSNI